jgi:hypothetical protein
LNDTTDSTGGYQIADIPLPGDTGMGPVEMTVTKEGFFDGPQPFDEAPPTAYCGDETLQDFELICSNPLFVTVEDTAGNPIPSATVSAAATYEYNADTDETYTTEGTTDNVGEVTFDVAGAADIDLTVSADGHDTLVIDDAVLGKDNMQQDNGDCYATPDAGATLCKWNNIVGTIKIGGQAAVGYKVEAVDMSVNPPAVIDDDTTTAAGVFSLEGLSSDNQNGQLHRVNLYNTSGSFVSTTGNFNVDTCGATSVFTYTNGAWTTDGTW